MVQHVAEFHRELLAKKYGYMRPGLEIKPWGEWSMTVIDPFGNHLVFYETTNRE